MILELFMNVGLVYINEKKKLITPAVLGTFCCQKVQINVIVIYFLRFLLAVRAFLIKNTQTEGVIYLISILSPCAQHRTHKHNGDKPVSDSNPVVFPLFIFPKNTMHLNCGNKAKP